MASITDFEGAHSVNLNRLKWFRSSFSHLECFLCKFPKLVNVILWKPLAIIIASYFFVGAFHSAITACYLVGMLLI